MTRPYFSAVARLGFLAPEIVDAIVSGRQPESLTAKRLIQNAALPLGWSDQKDMFGLT